MTAVTITEVVNEVTVVDNVVSVTAVEQVKEVTVAPGVTDHGALTGLADDDHAQYLNTARHAAIGSNPHGVTASDVGALPLSGGTLTGALVLDGDPAQALEAATKQYVDAAAGATNLDDLLDVDAANPTDTQVLTWDDDAGMWIAADAAGGASDVDDLTTATGNAGEMVRVASGGGLEFRTTAQVLSDIGAAASGHTHSYLPLAGGTLTGALGINTSSATALRVEQDGVRDNVLVVDTANGRVGIGTAPTSKLHLAYTGNALGVTVYAPDLTASVAMDLAIPLSTNPDNGKAFQVRVPGESYGRVMFYSDCALGFGPGNTTRDVFVRRSSAGEITIDTDKAGGAGGKLVTTGSIRSTLASAATAAITNIATLGHNSTGTPAAGFGAGLLYQLESSTTENRDAARIAAVWQTATDASRKADLVLSAFDTAEREGLRIRATGSAALLITSLPTSDPAVAGALWNDGNTVKVSTG